MSEAWTIPKYSVKALDMWPLPQAGSHTDILARSSPVPLSFSHKARVAHGGVGKSSRLSRASKRWDITAWDVFCLMIPSSAYLLFRPRVSNLDVIAIDLVGDGLTD